MVFNGKGSFPLNLALMLENVEHSYSSSLDNNGSYGNGGGTTTTPGGGGGRNMNHIISWLPCGSGFVIYNTDLFLIEVLPKFFK